MALFVVGTFLVAVAPILFNVIAWQIFYDDRSHVSGRLTRVVLCLNSASALVFVVTILLATSERITQVSVLRIGKPIFYLCICIAVLSGIKIRHHVYRTVFISSCILTVGWLIFGSLH